MNDAEFRSALQNLYWFYKMVQSGGPDGSELDYAVMEDAEMSARALEASHAV